MTRLPRLWIEPFGLTKKMDRMFNEFFTDWPETSTFGRTDVYEKDGQLVFESELPGVKKEDVHIRVEEGQLIISGETSRVEKVEQENYFRMGRRFGKFQRSFPLPDEVTEYDKINASLNDGVLTVEVPLNRSIKEKEKPVEIQIG